MHNFVLFSKQKINEFVIECVGIALSEFKLPADSTPTMRDWSTGCATRLFPDYHTPEHGVTTWKHSSHKNWEVKTVWKVLQPHPSLKPKACWAHVLPARSQSVPPCLGGLQRLGHHSFNSTFVQLAAAKPRLWTWKRLLLPSFLLFFL